MHEFGHTVMNLGLSNEDEDEANVSNPEEFWAEATQAWFSATARSDVNCDLRCRGTCTTGARKGSFNFWRALWKRRVAPQPWSGDDCERQVAGVMILVSYLRCSLRETRSCPGRAEVVDFPESE